MQPLLFTFYADFEYSQNADDEGLREHHEVGDVGIDHAVQHFAFGGPECFDDEFFVPRCQDDGCAASSAKQVCRGRDLQRAPPLVRTTSSVYRIE